MSDKIKIQESELEDYKKTCVKYEKTLLELPIRSAMDVLKYFTIIRKLRGKKKLGEIGARSQFGPFKKKKDSNGGVEIKFRTIETHHGNVIDEFSPVDYIDTPLAYDDPVLGEAIKKAGSTLLVLAQLQKARGQNIGLCAMVGEKNDDGDETVDICDGIVTIADREIDAGNISEELGNLVVLDEVLDFENTCDILKQVVFGLNSYLRREQSILLCPSDIADKYNESYLLTHRGIIYNDKYGQPWLEGSDKHITIVGLPELDGTDTAFITQTTNLICGVYNEADLTSVDIMRKDHYTLSSASDIFLGFEFRTIDPRRLKVIKLKNAKDVEQNKPAGQESDEQEPDDNLQQEG